MNASDNYMPISKLSEALSKHESSQRMQAALDAGTHPHDSYIEVLIERCAVEPDFYVRDTLTWALTRHSAERTVPLLLDQVVHGSSQARSQGLHTLSKIGDPAGWAAITDSVLQEPDDEIARAAWRAAVILAPEDEREYVAKLLVEQLGRNGRDVQLSLSQAIIALSDVSMPLLNDVMLHGNDQVRLHAFATDFMFRNPQATFEVAQEDARNMLAMLR